MHPDGKRNLLQEYEYRKLGVEPETMDLIEVCDGRVCFFLSESEQAKLIDTILELAGRIAALIHGF